ncbi:uncharacterized protein LOC110110350 isoform X3 [Dendrobium catenatum]|uniref:uncharacterized protein LOC110110350 isoform X3 n=1 Tax=Dendrobium catenatum TaxID=906689 RepID=UPI0009F3EEBB|nr:uncharacterized protein LOC110110350 isoform X3 [Dendrobium catenatum]
MERSTPVRKPHTSTADLLTWPETPQLVDPPVPDSATRRSHKPSGGISPALFGGPMTEEEVESVNKSYRKPTSGPKLKEMTGSGIFSTVNENDISESGSFLKNLNDKTSVKIYQQAISGISQISFSTEEIVSPRKPISLPEVAKQRELSGSLESAAEDKMKKQLSDAKTKELSGHDIFGPPPEVPLRPLAARNLELRGQLDFGEPAPPNICTSVKVSNPPGGQSHIMSSEEPVPKTSKKINNQKFQDLSGTDIFNSDAVSGSVEKPLSSAKLKEMSGSDIFADGKAASRDYFGGVRKPPGGGSSIALL